VIGPEKAETEPGGKPVWRLADIGDPILTHNRTSGGVRSGHKRAAILVQPFLEFIGVSE
jgi:hypothetical protein